MMLDTSQLMLSFEPDDPRSSRVTLRVSRSERDYFSSNVRASEQYSVVLPQPFKETAFMDEGGWRRTPRDGWRAENLGYRMWQQLPASLQAELSASGAGEARRVCIVSRASGIDDVPWEWLNPGPNAAPVAADNRFRFFRLVPCLYASPPLTTSPPVRVLIVTTNPRDERLVNPNEEVEILSGGLQSEDTYEVRHLMGPTFEALLDALRWAPHIMHYVGHGGIAGQNGALILHDHRDNTRWVTAPELSKIMPSSVRLLCLSTCVTAPNFQISGLLQTAHSPPDRSLPTTLVNQYALEPHAAETFWQKFYPQLATSGGDVVEAFHRSRMALFALGGQTWSWASFSLVVRDGTGHPMRIDATGGHRKERFAAEVQAEWSARLANSLAQRMQTLDPKVRNLMGDSLGDEEASIDYFRDELKKL
jgi:CHAT domain